MALRTVGVALRAEVSGYVNNLRTAARSTRDFTGELDKAAKGGKLDAVADQAATMGLTLTAAFAGITAVTARFDKAMSEVGAVSNATGAQMGQLRDAALAAGKATSFSATEAAQAQAELAKAGLSTADILGGALGGSLDLAAAGSLDLAEAADISAKAMNIFRLKGGDVTHIADVLAASANKSATDVHELGEALKMGGLAAQSAGMGLEETVGTLSAFADNALNGSDAGTSLKTAIMMLQAPTGKSAELMKELGIAAYDANGQFVGTAKLAGNLQSALGGLTQEQRNAALATIFGADGMRAANVLYGLGEQGVRDYIAAVDDQGAASDAARAKTDNLAGDIERLTGSLETLAIEAGSGSSSALRTLVKGADNLVGSLSGIPGPAQTAAVVVGGVAGAALLAAAGAAKMRAATATAGAQLSAMGPHGARAAQGLDRASKAAGRVGIALVALNTASALGGSSMNAQVDALAIGMDKFAKTGAVAGETARLFGGDMGKLDQALSDVADTGAWSSFVRGFAGFSEGLTGIGNLYDNSLQHSRERLSALDGALSQMVAKGNGQQAAAIFDEIAKRAAEQGVSIDELKKVLPGYAGALEAATGASGPAAGAMGDLGAAAENTKDEIQGLKDAFDRLFGIQMGIDRATIEYRRGIVELNKELKTGARTLNTNTEEGRKNADGVLDQIDRIKSMRQARIDNNMSIQDADALYAKDIQGLQASMRAADFTQAEILALTAAYLGIPDEASTEVSAPGATPATNQVINFGYKIKTLPNGKKVYISAETGQAITAAQALVARINAMRATIMVQANPGGGFGGNRHSGAGYSTGYRWGGVVEHARDGLIKLRDAAVYAPSGPARYAFAEPATGGEAFIPKNGDRNRSLGILEKAANWYGASVMPQQTMPQQPMYVTGGGGGITVNVRVDGSVVVEGTGVLKGLQKEVRIGGGVAKVFAS